MESKEIEDDGTFVGRSAAAAPTGFVGGDTEHAGMILARAVVDRRLRDDFLDVFGMPVVVSRAAFVGNL